MEKGNKLSIEINSQLDSEYVQKLAFKAGYDWRDNAGETVRYLNSNQLIFTEHKEIEFNNRVLRADRFNPMLSFPADAVKIHKLFYTPEYKVGDYVVLVGDKTEGVSFVSFMYPLLGSIQQIKEIDVRSKNPRVDLENLKWAFRIKDIARHATEKEIKAYKEYVLVTTFNKYQGLILFVMLLVIYLK